VVVSTSVSEKLREELQPLEASWWEGIEREVFPPKDDFVVSVIRPNA